MKTPNIHADPIAAEIIAECRRKLEEHLFMPIKVEAKVHFHLDNVPIEQFIADCAKAFGERPEHITGKDRSHPIIDYRQAIVFALYTYSSHGCKTVGQAFGQDHTTILSNVQKIGNYLYVNDQVAHRNMKVIKDLIENKYHPLISQKLAEAEAEAALHNDY